MSADSDTDTGLARTPPRRLEAAGARLPSTSPSAPLSNLLQLREGGLTQLALDLAAAPDACDLLDLARAARVLEQDAAEFAAVGGRPAPSACIAGPLRLNRDERCARCRRQPA